MTRLEAELTPEILKEVRAFLGAKSLKDMADMLGVSVNTYLNWENGKRPIPRMAEKLVTALVKNLEIVETMMFIEHYIKMLLRPADIAERLQAIHPFFDLQRTIERPISQFLFSILSAVPLEHLQNRLQELHDGKVITSPWRMKRLMDESNLDP